MKRFAMIFLAIAALFAAGMANAQRGGGGGGHAGGGGAWGGGGMHGGGGSWSGGGHGGGSWSGGGGAWHGGSGNWHGGTWHGGSWHGGNWNGGWRGSVVVGFGGPWWGWWPAYYPYYYPAAYPYYYPYYYGYDSDYYAGPMYDSGAYVQRPDAGAPSAQSQYQSGTVTSDGYSYYCRGPAGYYPQIQSCPSGWLRVVPQSAPSPTPQAQ